MQTVSTRLGQVMLVIGLALALASCETAAVQSDYDRSAAFGGYRTFVFVSREHPGGPNPLAVARAEDDIRDELQKRGYTQTPDPVAADIVVDFNLGAQERLDINSYPAAYGPWLGGVPPWGNDIDVRQYQEGSLTVDVFDAHTHRPVWHGGLKKALSRKDIEQPGDAIAKAVHSVLASFPSASLGAGELAR